MTLEQKHCSEPINWGIGIRADEPIVCRQRQNESSTLRKPVKPHIRWSRRPGADVDNVRGIKWREDPVAVDHPHIWA